MLDDAGVVEVESLGHAIVHHSDINIAFIDVVLVIDVRKLILYLEEAIYMYIVINGRNKSRWAVRCVRSGFC